MANYAHLDALSTPPSSYRPTRRDFLTSAVAVSIAAAMRRPPNLLAATAGQDAGKTIQGAKVVRISSQRVIEGLEVSRRRLRRMIDEGLRRMAERSDLAEAWGVFVKPGAKVLLKLSRLPGAGLRTESAMLAALVDSLTAVGYATENITVAGCDASIFIEGLAPASTGWSHRTVSVAGEAEQIRRYLDGIDVVINVPSVSDHNLAGVACAMMNVSLPLIRRPGRYYDGRLHEAVTSICQSEPIIPSPSLTIVNALRCVYDGGPAVDEDRIAYDRSIWLSTDMVAIDRLATQWIDRRRRAAKLPTLAAIGRSPKYIEMAAQRGLGTAELRSIITETHEM